MTSQRPEFYFSPLISCWRRELDGNSLFTQSRRAQQSMRTQKTKIISPSTAFDYLTGLRMQSTARAGNGSSLIFECSFIKIRATVRDAKSQSQGETEKAAARFRSDHIRCFPEGHGSQAEHPPVGAAQFPLRSGQMNRHCGSSSLSGRQTVQAIRDTADNNITRQS